MTVNYYDVVLMLIPTLLAGVSGILTLTGVPPTTAILPGGAFAMLLIAHALFVRSPVSLPASDSPPEPDSTPIN